jgi:hypothetical protein
MSPMTYRESMEVPASLTNSDHSPLSHQTLAFLLDLSYLDPDWDPLVWMLMCVRIEGQIWSRSGVWNFTPHFG